MTNTFDGHELTYFGVTWKHGWNEQFEFWTTGIDHNAMSYDVARRLDEPFWSVYQHSKGRRPRSSLMMDSGTTHLDQSFTHGQLYHINHAAPDAFLQAASSLIFTGNAEGGEPIRAIDCDTCLQIGKHLPIRLNIANDLELAEQALVKAREYLFVARDKVKALYDRPEIHTETSSHTLHTMGSYLEQAAAQAGNGWVHKDEGARGRLDAIKRLVQYEADLRL
jgi:hypothetical protein